MRWVRSFIPTAALLLSACGHVKISNQEWCGVYPDMSGADCFDTLDSASRELDDKGLAAYFDVPHGARICGDAQSFADNKANIEKLCSETGKCDYETQQAITRFFSNLKRFNSHVKNLE